MSATTQGSSHVAGHKDDTASGRRDFLAIFGGTAAAIGVGSIAWPLVDSMNPSADVLALSAVDVALDPIAPGGGIKVMWRGKPIFVRHRTPEEIKTAQSVPPGQLIDPAADSVRVKAGHEQWVVLIGICTHLGCVPLGTISTEPRGDWGGWFCPCHGSQYDVAGRVRHGPAPANLAVPPYAFTSDTKIKIG